MSSQTIRLHDGQAVGKRIDDTFMKLVWGSRHRLRKSPPGPGWAIQTEIIQELREAGVTEIQLFDQETDVQYTVTMEKFIGLGRPIDLGHGKQTCLNIRHWDAAQADSEIIKDLI